MLYIRLFVLMGISFYMSRVVLRILGVEDLGIYNVVGGIVTMMTFINSSLNITTQRFLNYEMGKGNYENLYRVFSMSFWSYAIIAFVVLVICETVGLWFFYEYLNIPADRLNAAFWVYQFSIFTFIANLFTVPYNSTIIAHESMDFYAYVSVGDAILKLGLVYVLEYLDYDKLWLYGFMMLLATCFIWFCNWWYCRANFAESKLRMFWDNGLFKKMFYFSTWSSVGAIGSSLNYQGCNILINVFFNPAFNGARAIAYQVYFAINSFSANFLTAVRPQILKSYAEGNTAYMYKLIFSSSKLSIFLLLPLIIPVILNTEYILSLWLGAGEVTEYMVTFTQLAIMAIPISTCFPTLELAAQASGKISSFQITASVLFVMIPLSTYVLFKCGFSAEWSFIMVILWSLIGIFARLAVLNRDMQFPIMSYIKKVILPVISTLMITFAIIVYPICSIKLVGFRYLLFSSSLVISVMAIVIWFFGLEKYEKTLLNSYVRKKFRKK